MRAYNKTGPLSVHVLSSAIGGEQATPIVSRADVTERGCVVLFCTDGLTKHVLADIASVDDLASCSPAEPSVLERGSNQALVNLFEVDGSTGCICLLTERTDNKSPLHFRSRCPSGGSHVRAEEFVPIAC